MTTLRALPFLLLVACAQTGSAPHAPLWGAWTSAVPAESPYGPVVVDLQVDVRQTPATRFLWRTTTVNPASSPTPGCTTRLWFAGGLTATCETDPPEGLPLAVADLTGCVDMAVDGVILERTGCHDAEDLSPRQAAQVTQYAPDFERLAFAFVGDRLWLGWDPVVVLRPCEVDTGGGAVEACGPGELPQL